MLIEGVHNLKYFFFTDVNCTVHFMQCYCIIICYQIVCCFVGIGVHTSRKEYLVFLVCFGDVVVYA